MQKAKLGSFGEVSRLTLGEELFRKAYPGVRIYPTLGNNDSDCGDYAVAPNGAFLANFRDVWVPIVGSRSFHRLRSADDA